MPFALLVAGVLLLGMTGRRASRGSWAVIAVAAAGATIWYLR